MYVWGLCLCSGAGRGAGLELQQSCEEFYGNHVVCGPDPLLCRVNDGITGFRKPQCMLMDVAGSSCKTRTHVLYSSILSCSM